MTFDLLVFDPILLKCTNTINITDYENEASILEFEIMCFRDRGATLIWGGGGGGGGGGRAEGTISDSILGGDTKHFLLLILYNFKNIGRARAPPAPLPPPLLRGPCV